MDKSATTPERFIMLPNGHMDGERATSPTLGWKLFTVAETDYCWEDAVLAAMYWGDWSSLERQVRQGAACVQHLLDTRTAPPQEEIEAAANEFRYQRDLLSSEETEEWLGAMGLSAEAWMEQMQRSVLRKKWADQLADLESRYPVPAHELADHVVAEAVCGGDLARWLDKLAAGAVTHALRRGSPDSPDSARAAEPLDQDHLPQPASGNAVAWALPGLARERVAETFDHVAQLDAAFRAFGRRVQTPAAIKAQISSHLIEWTLFRGRLISFPDEEMAREAALCVREDGRTLADIARESSRPLREETFFFEQAPVELRDVFLAARTHELLGPIPVAHEFMLAELLHKKPPSSTDRDIRERAADAVLRKAVKLEVGNRVRWHIPRLH